MGTDPQRAERVIQFITSASLQLGHNQIGKIGKGFRRHCVGEIEPIHVGFDAIAWMRPQAGRLMRDAIHVEGIQADLLAILVPLLRPALKLTQLAIMAEARGRDDGCE